MWQYRNDDRETALLLLDHGAAINEAMLFEAARLKAPETAALLIERGVPINAKDGADWTALHYALTDGIEGDVDKLAMMLIGHGADVNTATALVAWTPLHLAASLNKPDIVTALIARGAKVNAQTRISGWTPLHLALQQTGADEVVTILLAAGAEDRMSDASTFLSAFILGTRDRQSIGEISTPPIVMGLGGNDFAEGSFTTAGASERLVFESIGFNDRAREFSRLVGLVDQDGQTHLLWIIDRYFYFERLCLDPLTGFHHAMFDWSIPGGSGTGDISETVYMYFDTGKKTLVEGFRERHAYNRLESNMATREKSSAWPDRDGRCRWRQAEKVALETYHRTLDALRVGSALPASATEWDSFVNYQGVLPTRVIAASIVHSSLATFRDLPAGIVPEIDRVEVERWEIVIVNGIHTRTWQEGIIEIRPGFDGVVLVHDKEREEWRSIHDCGDINVQDLRDNALIVEFREHCRGLNEKYYFFTLKIDLLTYEIQEYIDLEAFGL